VRKIERGVGNPLGERKQSKEEAASWMEAHHFTCLLIEDTGKVLDYLEGKGGAPRAYSVMTRAICLWRAEQSALAYRLGRLRAEEAIKTPKSSKRSKAPKTAKKSGR
jgi:hypothetical protein